MADIKGIKKIASESKKYTNGYYSPEYLELFFNKKTYEAWTIYQCNIGHNSWTEYKDPDIIKCGIITEKMSMNEIRIQIKNALYGEE